MERFNEIPTERPAETGGETSVDTQAEVDLISGGVGFDDSPVEENKGEETQKQQKTVKKEKEA